MFHLDVAPEFAALLARGAAARVEHVGWCNIRVCNGGDERYVEHLQLALPSAERAALEASLHLDVEGDDVPATRKHPCCPFVVFVVFIIPLSINFPLCDERSESRKMLG